LGLEIEVYDIMAPQSHARRKWQEKKDIANHCWESKKEVYEGKETKAYRLTPFAVEGR
jgi:hypothetical protein